MTTSTGATIGTELNPMPPLPGALSPTSNVRRSCADLMTDPPVCPSLDGDGDGDGEISSGVGVDAAAPSTPGGGARTVGISPGSLCTLARSIATSIQCSGGGATQFAPWDADGWHYTASSYRRASSLGAADVELMRMERVALYVLTLDAINFCFWPTGDTTAEEVMGKKNLLEYEHLAIALKTAAEADDDGAVERGGTEEVEDFAGNFITERRVRSEDSYALSPSNLAALTVPRFREVILPHLPDGAPDDPGGAYVIPNLAERVRLLNELGSALLEYHDGSALTLLSHARRSADRLVALLTSSCPGFRDEAIDGARGRQVRFYKRAQIATADLWAALGPNGGVVDGSRLAGHPLGSACDFTDIERLTMFADYRVPQLLRHLGVMRYSPGLARTVDAGTEIRAGSDDELYIRAATVAAVDRLVGEVNDLLTEKGRSETSEQAEKVCAVKMDWHLWQVGERLDREGKLGRHHRVRTTFY